MNVITIPLGSLGTNCHILAFDNKTAVLVDIGAEDDRLYDIIEKNHFTVKAILLTHGHYDHIAGVERARKTFDVPVYLHEADVPMILDNDKNLATWLADTPLSPITKWQSVKEGDEIKIDGVPITVLHTPGHTPGSVCYAVEHILFTGDTLFHLSRGRTDFPGGSDAQLLQSLRRLKNLNDNYSIYPGHNENSTLEIEKAKNLCLRGA